MAINRVSPGIEIREFDRSIVARGPRAPSGALAGVFRSGPINTPVLIGNKSQLIETFGEPSADNMETFYTAFNFLNYTDKIYVVRVANNSLSSYAKSTIELESVSILSQSGAFTNSDIIHVLGGNTTTSANLSIVTNSSGTITAISIVNGGIFDSSSFPIGNNGILNIAANNSTTADTTLYLNVTYKPVSVANQQAFSVETSMVSERGVSYYDDTDWRSKVDYDGWSTDTNLTFISRTPTDDFNNYRVSIVHSKNAYSSSLVSAFNSASANVSISSGAKQVTIQTANSTHAANLVNSIGFRDNLFINLPAAKGAAAISGQNLITGKVVDQANVILYFQNPWNIGTRTIYANSTHFYSGSGNTLQASTQGIVRKWEFAGKAGFSELSTTGYSDVSALTRPDGTKIVDKVYVAVTNDKNELLWSTTGSRVRSVATNFKNNYYVDKINKDVNNKYIWWANHISGLTTSNTAGALIDSTQSLPFHSFLGRGSDVVTENSVTLATLMDGYDKFADKTTIDIDVIMTGKSVGGTNGEGLTNYIIENICEKRRDCIVFSSPQKDDLTNEFNKRIYQKINDFSESVINSSFCFLDSGYKTMYDRYSDSLVDVPLNGDIAGIYMRTIRRLGPWWSPAGYNRGEVIGGRSLLYNPSEFDRDQLYPACVNPVVKFPGEDILLFGDKTTLNQGSAFDRINVRGLFIYLQKVIADISKFTLFEFNDEFTRARFVGQIDPILRDVKGRRGIIDYRLICDETNNTPDIIDANGFVADIYIKPSRSINYIQLNFVALATGTQFNEIIGQFEI